MFLHRHSGDQKVGEFQFLDELSFLMMFVTLVSVMKLLQKPTDGPKVQQPQPEVSKDTESDQFNSFQFWREPLPALDSELLGLLVGRSRRKLVFCFVLFCFFQQCGDAPDSWLKPQLFGVVCSGSGGGSELKEQTGTDGRTDGHTDLL